MRDSMLLFCPIAQGTRTHRRTVDRDKIQGVLERLNEMFLPPARRTAAALGVRPAAIPSTAVQPDVAALAALPNAVQTAPVQPVLPAIPDAAFPGPTVAALASKPSSGRAGQTKATPVGSKRTRMASSSSSSSTSSSSPERIEWRLPAVAALDGEIVFHIDASFGLVMDRDMDIYPNLLVESHHGLTSSFEGIPMGDQEAEEASTV
jgi:hypothetical protein